MSKNKIAVITNYDSDSYFNLTLPLNKDHISY